MNTKIIKEFEKLISFIETNEKNTPNSVFRLKNIKAALSVIRKYPVKLTFDNLDDFGTLQHIGKGTIERIKEILLKGYLEELKDYKETKKTDLDKVIGIGKSKIKELEILGIKSVKDLNKKIADNEIKVSDTITMGLKYHNIYKENIPRKEIDNIKKLLENVLDNKYIFEICGSYRRGKDTSSDVDVLISTKETKKINHLKIIINLLMDNLKLNNNKPFLVDNLTEKIQTKYMGFCKYKNNPVRRIDIRFVHYKNFYSALLYFTGSADFNRNMRNIAKKIGYKLSEYGLKNINTGIIEKISSEENIFNILNLPYVKPIDR